MEKRVFLAVALSLLVVLSWSAINNKLYPIANNTVTQDKVSTQSNIESAGVSFTGPQSALAIPESEPLPFIQKDFEVIFDESAAAIKEIEFKNYANSRFKLLRGFFLSDDSLRFKKYATFGQSIDFLHEDKNKKIIKRFIFSNSIYTMELEIEVENLSAKDLKINLPIIIGVLDLSSPAAQSRFQDIVMIADAKTTHLNGSKEVSAHKISVLGIRDKYFCAIVEPREQILDAFVRRINKKTTEIGYFLPNVTLSPGQNKVYKFHVYLGPQDLKLVNQANPAWASMINYGTFDIIAQILFQSLEFIYGIVKNWGWAIVILSALIYIILFPFSLMQMRSMKKMQALQPQVEELKKTYKNDSTRQQREIMELYRVNKANPFGGCLPMLPQLPIFFALYQVLMRSIALKGAQFMWIKDLSEPDRLLLLGKEVNILPILMAIIMFVQQKLTLSSAASSEAQEQQKFMVIAFPIIFGILFYRMPSGLVLYWSINSALALTTQLKTAKVK